MLNLSINEATKSSGQTVIPNLTRENLLLMLEAGKQLENPNGMSQKELASYFGVHPSDEKRQARLQQIIQAELKAGRVAKKQDTYYLIDNNEQSQQTVS